MTAEERINYCKTCKYGKFNAVKESGCLKYYVRPEFENECHSYEKEFDEISGFLAWFLWLGIGFSCFIICNGEIVSMVGAGMSNFCIILNLIALAVLFIVSVLTIMAFYERETNAVALAKTYIVMIMLYGVVSIICSYICNDIELEGVVYCRLVVGVILYLYIQFSSRIKEMMPKINRTWKIIEKTLLGVYVFCCVLFLGLCINMPNNYATNILLNKDALISNMVSDINKEVPMEVDEYTKLTKVSKERSEIIYNYTFELNKEDLSPLVLENVQLYMQENCLYELAIDGVDDESAEFYKLIFENGLILKPKFNK